jgi:hypothetical protein
MAKRPSELGPEKNYAGGPNQQVYICLNVNIKKEIGHRPQMGA